MERNLSSSGPASSVPGDAGLGLRRSLLPELTEQQPANIDFFEVAPENWINVGGTYGKQFRTLTERYPLICHGLSLSIGGPEKLDHQFLLSLKEFFELHDVQLYSEHLSYCSDHGHLYDLMPMPFTTAAVDYVAGRIREVQDVLERRIAIENISYYTPQSTELSEIEFIHAVLEEADCGLLLDINNIFVNSINHRYDARDFLYAMPAERIDYFHIAGHYVESEDLRIDTHGAAICDPVFELLGDAYRHFGKVPTLLERDFNIPPLAELLAELEQVIAIQHKETGNERQAV